MRAVISSQQFACLLWHCLVARCLRAETTVRKRNFTPAALPKNLARSCSVCPCASATHSSAVCMNSRKLYSNSYACLLCSACVPPLLARQCWPFGKGSAPSQSPCSILKSAAMTNGVRIECVNSKICAILTWLAACVCGKVCKYYRQSDTLQMPKKWVSNPNDSKVPQGRHNLPKTWRISHAV